MLNLFILQKLIMSMQCVDFALIFFSTEGRKKQGELAEAA